MPKYEEELDRMFHLADEVVRHKVIRIPDKVAGRAPRSVPVPVPEPEAAAEADATANGV